MERCRNWKSWSIAGRRTNFVLVSPANWFHCDVITAKPQCNKSQCQSISDSTARQIQAVINASLPFGASIRFNVSQGIDDVCNSLDSTRHTRPKYYTGGVPLAQPPTRNAVASIGEIFGEGGGVFALTGIFRRGDINPPTKFQIIPKDRITITVWFALTQIPNDLRLYTCATTARRGVPSITTVAAPHPRGPLRRPKL